MKKKTFSSFFSVLDAMTTTDGNSNSPSTSQQQITPVQRKLQKILDLKLESDKDLIESLKYLSTFFNENSVRTRRSLRSTIEKRSLTLNDQFEECFRVVKEQLDQLNNTVTSISTCCDDMTQRLKVKTKQKTFRFVVFSTFLLFRRSKLKHKN